MGMNKFILMEQSFQQTPHLICSLGERHRQTGTGWESERLEQSWNSLLSAGPDYLWQRGTPGAGESGATGDCGPAKAAGARPVIGLDRVGQSELDKGSQEPGLSGRRCSCRTSACVCAHATVCTLTGWQTESKQGWSENTTGPELSRQTETGGIWLALKTKSKTLSQWLFLG